MQVDICNSNKDFSVGAGDLIVTKLKNGSIQHYLLVRESDRGIITNYRLLNMSSSNIMASFSSRNPNDSFRYIRDTLKAEVLDVIPAKKLKVGLK